MSFDTENFMIFKFIIKLLECLNLIEDGTLRLKSLKQLIYKKEEIVEKLQYVNFRAQAVKLNTRNKDIRFEILTTSVTCFSELKIIGLMDDGKVYEYIDILLELFKDDFYMIHVLDLNEYDKKEQFMEKFRFLKNKRYSLVNKLFPLHFYEDIGVNIGVSRLMYFGKRMFEFISKDKLLNSEYVYSSQELNDIVVLKIYSNLNNKRNKSLERHFCRSLEIDKLENKIRNDKYMNYNYLHYFLKGHEKYQRYYFYDDYINEVDNRKSYAIPILYFDLIIKRYKNTCFEFVDEDFGAGEIFGCFLYCKENEAFALKRIEDVEAYIMIMIFDITSDINEYAEKNGYTVTFVEKNHYLFIKEDENTLEKFHYYILDEEKIDYKIELKVRKDLVSKSEYKKIVTEYDKMIKSSRRKKW